MPSGSISTANYVAVISDLRAKQAEIARTIAMLEALAGIDAAAPATPPPANSEPKSRVVATPPINRPKAQESASGNNGIGDACAGILREHDAHAPLSTRQVLDLLTQSGFEINASNPINNVWSALDNRTRTKKDVRKIGRGWRYVVPEKPAPAETANSNGLAVHQ